MSKKLESLPYRTPSAPDRYDWYLLIDGSPHPLPGGMPSWDYQTDLNFCRDMLLKPSEIRQECDFSDDTELSLQVVLDCAKSFYRETVWNEDLGTGEEEWHEISFPVSGKFLTDKIELTTRIVLKKPMEKRMLVAHRGQSVLHEEKSVFSLHGTAPRFPTAEISFSDEPRLDSNGLWSLIIGHELESPVSQAVQLYLNRDKSAFINRMRENDVLTSSMVQTDVVRRFLEHALDHTEFDPAAEYEEGSVGSVCRSWFQQIFVTRSREEARKEMNDNRFSLEAKIQGVICGGVK